jgi:galactokinase
VDRRLAESRYGERREECEAALAAARVAGVAPADARALRDVDEHALPELERTLPERLFRRARHVIRENARVEAAFEALHDGDAARMGRLLRAGMQSLRDDFEVSTPELDALCALGDATPGVFGSRLTGAGFGGCTLHLVRAGAAAEASRVIAEGFERRFGRRPPIQEVRAAAGACAIPLR